MNIFKDENLDYLKHNEGEGTLHHQGRRMLLFDINGIGFYRKALIEKLGLINGSILLWHSGYATGYHNAVQLKKEFPAKDLEFLFKIGLQRTSLFGWASVIFHSIRIDREACILEIECEWLNSFEAEIHLLYFGKSEGHVCSTTGGYICGFGAALMGCDVFILEKECVAKGSSRCFFVIKSEFARRDEEIDIIKSLMSKHDLDYEEVVGNVYDENRSIRQLIHELVAQHEKVKVLETQLFYLQENERESGDLIGTNPAFKKALQLARTVAQSDSTVLVTGETGTGKELFARYIHAHTSERTLPLIVVNCAALPEGLVESELFGHEKGSFTGAVQRKPGKFEIADNSTIFLDEIGELPLETQIKFLRVLQEGEFQRVGGTQIIKTKVRVIAATNQNLQELVKAGKFRADLYYRLNVFPISIPSLRARSAEDIVQLTNYFVQIYNRKFRKAINSINKSSLDKLKSYQFPGNVRELQHLIERAVLLAEGQTLTIDLLPQEPSKIEAITPIAIVPPAESLLDTEESLTLEEIERRYIKRILRETNNVVAGENGAAKILGLHTSTLRSRMKKLGLK